MNSMHHYPKAYIRYLAEYHGSRDYFECHEIMEEYWKSQPHTRYTGCWLVFIRISVACYHARRGNWAGARKMLRKASEEIDPVLMTELGMNGAELAGRVRGASEQWSREDNPVYRDIDLPIADPVLAEASVNECIRRGWSWCTPLEKVDLDIVQRHLTRDRAHVVEARRLAAERKGKSRP